MEEAAGAARAPAASSFRNDEGGTRNAEVENRSQETGFRIECVPVF
jgi:hypothetical protein